MAVSLSLSLSLSPVLRHPGIVSDERARPLARPPAAATLLPDVEGVAPGSAADGDGGAGRVGVDAHVERCQIPVKCVPKGTKWYKASIIVYIVYLVPI